jgi:ankyrin repeat protein
LSLLAAGVAYFAFLWGIQPPPDDIVQHKFILAARKGDLPILEKLHSQGAQIDHTASYGNGAFHSGPAMIEAIESRHRNIVRWLLENGSNPNLLIATETPLDLAEMALRSDPTDPNLKEILSLLKARGGKSLHDLP